MIRDFEKSAQYLRKKRKKSLRGRVYPAVFTYKEGYIVVTFPDIDGCCVQAETVDDAYEFAKEFLTLQLHGMKKKPLPTLMDEIEPEEGQFIMELEVDRALSLTCYKYFIRELPDDPEMFEEMDLLDDQDISDDTESPDDPDKE